MATSISKLAIMLTTDTSGMMKGFAQARAQASQFAAKFNGGGGGGIASVARGGGGMIGGMGGAAGVAAITATAAGIYKAAQYGSDLASQMEKASVAFRVMLGSGDSAKQLLSDIRGLAMDTPFDQAGLQQNAQTLLQFGMAGENVIPTLKMLGDVALGDAERMSRLTLAFGQMNAAGRLTGQDLLQMINAGFNPLQTIAEQTGLSVGELRKQMEAGAITSQHVAEAFKIATQEGGRFHNLNKEMLGTMSGQWARLKENVGEFLRPSGQAINSVLKSTFSALNDGFGSLERFRDWLHGVPPAAKEVAKAVEESTDAFKGLTKAVAELGELNSKGQVSRGWGIEGFAGSLERFNKLQMDLGERGARFADQFRTPGQEFAAAIVEAKTLFDGQAISAEVYARAIEKAKEDLFSSADSAKQLQKALEPRNNTALSRNSSQAFSEVMRAQQQQAASAAVEKQKLDEERKANALLEKVITAIERKEEVRISEVNF